MGLWLPGLRWFPSYAGAGPSLPSLLAAFPFLVPKYPCLPTPVALGIWFPRHLLSVTSSAITRTATSLCCICFLSFSLYTYGSSATIFLASFCYCLSQVLLVTHYVVKLGREYRETPPKNGLPEPPPPRTKVFRAQNKLTGSGDENWGGGGRLWFRVKQHRGGFRKFREPLLGHLLGTSRLTVLIKKVFSNRFLGWVLDQKGVPQNSFLGRAGFCVCLHQLSLLVIFAPLVEFVTPMPVPPVIGHWLREAKGPLGTRLITAAPTEVEETIRINGFPARAKVIAGTTLGRIEALRSVLGWSLGLLVTWSTPPSCSILHSGPF